MGMGGLRGGVGLETPDSTSTLLSAPLPHQMQLVCSAWPRPSPAPCSRGGKPLLGLSVLLGLTRGGGEHTQGHTHRQHFQLPRLQGPKFV